MLKRSKPEPPDRTELALAALTSISFTLEGDSKVDENLTTLFQQYPLKQIHEGAFYALTAILVQQALEAGIPVVEYINQQRPRVAKELRL